MIDDLSLQVAFLFLIIAILLLLFNQQIVEKINGKKRRKSVNNNIFCDFNGKRLKVRDCQVIREKIITNNNSSITTEEGNLYFDNSSPLRGINTVDIGISSINDLASGVIVLKLHDRNELKTLQDEIIELKREKQAIYIELKRTKKFIDQLMKDQFKSVADAKKQLGSTFGGMFGGGLGGIGGGMGGYDDDGMDMP